MVLSASAGRALFNLRKASEFVDTLFMLAVGFPLGASRVAYQRMVTRTRSAFVPVDRKRRSPISTQSILHLHNGTNYKK